MPIVFGVFWLLAAGVGFVWILNYQSTSGAAGIAPEHWPTGTQITLDSQRDTLVMFAHPQCPCTRASMEELNRLLARTEGKGIRRIASDLGVGVGTVLRVTNAGGAANSLN